MNPLEFIVSTAAMAAMATMAAMLSLGVFIGRATCTHAYHDAVQKTEPSLVRPSLVRRSSGEDIPSGTLRSFVIDTTGEVK
jgi:hypothetical protein